MDASPWAPPEAPDAPPEPEDDDDVMPWLDIWFRPAPTMRYLLRHQATRGVFGIAVLNGMVTARVNGLDLGSELLVRLIAGPFVGLISLTVFGLIVLGLGRVFDGKGDYIEVMSALAWGGLPYTAACLLTHGIVIGTVLLDLSVVWLGLAALGVTVVGWVWSFAWQVATVAEAHRFGWFQAAVTLGAPYLVLFGCLGLGFAALVGSVDP